MDVILNFGVIKYNIDITKLKGVPFFDSYISGRWKLQKNKEIDLSDRSITVFHILLDYIKNKITTIPIEHYDELNFYGFDFNSNNSNTSNTSNNLNNYMDTSVIQLHTIYISRITCTNETELIQPSTGFHKIISYTTHKLNDNELTIYTDHNIVDVIIEPIYLIINIPAINSGVWINKFVFKLIETFKLSFNNHLIKSLDGNYLEFIYNKSDVISSKEAFDLDYNDREKLSRSGFIIKIPIEFFPIHQYKLSYTKINFTIDINQNIIPELIEDLIEGPQAINRLQILNSFINQDKYIVMKNTYFNIEQQFRLYQKNYNTYIFNEPTNKIIYYISPVNTSLEHIIPLNLSFVRELIIKSEIPIKNISLKTKSDYSDNNSANLLNYSNILLKTLTFKVFKKHLPNNYYYIPFFDNPNSSVFEEYPIHLYNTNIHITIDPIDSNTTLDKKKIIIFGTKSNVLIYKNSSHDGGFRVYK